MLAYSDSAINVAVEKGHFKIIWENQIFTKKYISFRVTPPSKYIDELKLTLSLLRNAFHIIAITEHKIRKGVVNGCKYWYPRI